MEYLKFETAFHNARVNLSTKIYQTPFYGVVEEMVHFKCTIPKLLTSCFSTRMHGCFHPQNGTRFYPCLTLECIIVKFKFSPQNELMFSPQNGAVFSPKNVPPPPRMEPIFSHVLTCA